MNRHPHQRSLPLRLTVQIPIDWTPHQAIRILDLLEDLHQQIWELYEPQVLPLIIEQEQIDRYAADASHLLSDPDDDMPF